MAGRLTPNVWRPQFSSINPFRFIWELLCSVKFALMLVGIAAAACMLGVLLPQVPIPMRNNPAARSAWLELQREQFGPFTGLMDSLDLFDIFYSPWFYFLWLVIIVAVTVCTVSRFRPIARSVHKAPKVVPARYFQTAHHRADFSHPGGVEAVESALRKRRYSVRRIKTEDTAIYLFAERYQWAAYGTFLTHLALLMVLIGGLFTVLGGFSRLIVIAETAGAAPVFDRPGPNQLFIEVLDAHRGLDGNGNIVDFHSTLEVRRGGQVISCKTTVNDPCGAFGFRIHQAAWFNDIAKIRITAPDGQIEFDQTLDFNSETTRVPHLLFADREGQVQYDGPLPQLGTHEGASPGRHDDLALSVLQALPQRDSREDEQRDYLVAWRMVDDELRVLVSGSELVPLELEPGGTLELATGSLRYVGFQDIPAIQIDDMPGAPRGSVAQMVETSTGTSLILSGIDNESVRLAEGEEHRATNGYTYRFERRVEASGLDVRKDPGDVFIWIAVVMAMLGLAMTFYLPRRRLWVKVTDERTYFAGMAERTTRLGVELLQMGREMGSTDPVQTGEELPSD